MTVGGAAKQGYRPSESSPPVLAVHEVSKSFAGNLVLADFSLSLLQGEIHVLLGQNGSGKSTLIKILSGYHKPDSGSVTIDEQALVFGSADHGRELGLRFVHQDLGLVDTLSVLDNLSLGFGYPTRIGTIDRRNTNRRARELLNQVGMDIDLRGPVAGLAPSQRTGVAVARALYVDSAHPPRILILDEPTAALPPDEVKHLVDILRAAAARGIPVLYVTHRLEEIAGFADRVSVLRDGQLVATADAATLSREDLIHYLAGAALDEEPEARPALLPDHSSLLMSVEGLASGPVHDLSFTASAGEIVGLAGLTGSGRETVLGAIYGAINRTGGPVTVRGVALPANRPDVSNHRGVGFLPAERKTRGGMMTMSARENLTITDLSPFWRRAFLRKKQERTATRSWFERLRIRPALAIEQPLAAFSGGNQQKLLFAKWLRRSLTVFLLDEPTQGVDVEAKAALHQELVAAAASGTGVVVSSTDSEELATICTRVLVLVDGTLSEELSADRLTAPSINTACNRQIVRA